MTAAERAELLVQLAASRETLLASIAGVTAEEASRKPDTGWSILECVKHCAVVEAALLEGTAFKAEAAEREDRATFEQAILKRAGKRERKVEAPPFAHPSNRHAALDAAAAAFVEARAATMQFLERCDTDLRDRRVDHPIGRITARECLLLMIQHPVRHAAQIAELRSR